MSRICLIGEADPFIARLLRRFAEESGLDVVRAGAGQEVLELARQVHPAVIILEVDLPGQLRGWQAAQALEADPELCGIPVITCSWGPETEARTYLNEAAGHLQKPELHYNDFVAALRRAGIA
jgi:CheY-like chemotaxis protein